MFRNSTLTLLDNMEGTSGQDAMFSSVSHEEGGLMSLKAYDHDSHSNVLAMGAGGAAGMKRWCEKGCCYKFCYKKDSDPRKTTAVRVPCDPEKTLPTLTDAVYVVCIGPTWKGGDGFSSEDVGVKVGNYKIKQDGGMWDTVGKEDVFKWDTWGNKKHCYEVCTGENQACYRRFFVFSRFGARNKPDFSRFARLFSNRFSHCFVRFCISFLGA